MGAGMELTTEYTEYTEEENNPELVTPRKQSQPRNSAQHLSRYFTEGNKENGGQASC
jgi:hypothetical protein